MHSTCQESTKHSSAFPVQKTRQLAIRPYIVWPHFGPSESMHNILPGAFLSLCRECSSPRRLHGSRSSSRSLVMRQRERAFPWPLAVVRRYETEITWLPYSASSPSFPLSSPDVVFFTRVALLKTGGKLGMFAPLLSVLWARGDTINTCPVNEKVMGLWTVSVWRFANIGFQLFVLHVGSSGILQHFLFCHSPDDHLLHKYMSDTYVPGTGGI